MARRPVLLTLAVLALLLVIHAAAAADDDDPIVKGKKTSEWLELLVKYRTAKTDDPAEQEINVKRRLVILDALALNGPKVPNVLPAVFKTLKEDPNENVRKAAARWLGQTAVAAKQADLDPRSTLEALGEALKNDKAPLVRQAAAMSVNDVARVRTDLRVVVPALTDALKDSDGEVRESAAEALGRIGNDAAPAVPALLDALKDKKATRFVRSKAALALVLIAPDDRVVVALGEVLADKEAPRELRADAAKALGRLGKDAAAAVPALAAALGEKDADLRRAAAAALAQTGGFAKAALPALKQALKDEDKEVRTQAVRALGGLGSDGADAVPALTEALKDPVLEVRLAAVQALGGIGPDAKAAVPALTGLTQDAQKDVREAATEALKKIQGMP